MANKKKLTGSNAAGRGAFGYDSYMGEVAEDPAAGPVRMLADGGLEIEVGGNEEAKPRTSEFDVNLAAELSESEQRTLGNKMKEFVEVDLQSREPWEQRMTDGLSLIGLQDVPDDAVAFQGAAQATYPGLVEAMVQFQASAMEELMPPEGPVKAGVIGKSSEELEAQAERVADFMNYQLMIADSRYYWETDQLLLYLPYAGSAFRKVGPDPLLGITRATMVPASDFIVPYWATCLESAPRYTHRYTMSQNNYKRAVANGYFVDADFGAVTPQGQAQGLTSKLGDASDDRVESFHEDDRDLHFYEITLDWDFDWETRGNDRGHSLPYAITFEWETGRAVRIARVWDENDAACKRDVWFVHYKFLPGLGFYGWGFIHVLGGLGRAASGAVRLLLDGSATASLQGGFKSKEAKLAGTMNFSPGVWVDVDMSAEELAKSFFSPPFKEPSPALFKSLELLVSRIERFASTTEAMVGDAKNTGPVGTTVALIEQGSKLRSGIHRRVHHSAGEEFRLVAKSNHRFMELDEYPYGVGGDRTIMRKDFGPGVDILPVSDPNIFSNVQRIALGQAALELINSAPDLYTIKARRKAHRMMWRVLRVPDWEDYIPEEESHRLDPVSENMSLLNGGALQAFQEQDHAAHLQLHDMFEQEILGMDPEIQQRVIPVLKAHKAAHFAFAYRQRMEQAVMEATGIPLPPFDPNNPEENEELPPDIEAMVAQACAQYAPPPAAPAPAPDPEAAKDEAIIRDQDRKDRAAEREEQRKDMIRMAEARRDGLVSDL